MLDSVHTRRLPNGMEIAVEPISQAGSVSFGFWLRNGSAHEPEQSSGVTHMIEHLLFKGADGRSCLEIAATIDELGGTMDAFTAREITCYSAKVRTSDFERAFALLSGMLLRPDFDPDDIEMERKVILEELSMVQDTPDDLVGEHFYHHLFHAHPLGRSILGDEGTIAAISRDDVLNWHKRAYAPDQLVLTVAGTVDPEQVFSLAEKFLGDHAATSAFEPQPSPQLASGEHIYRRRRLEQVQMICGLPAVSATDPRRHALEVLCNYLGGTMSSRLFQEIRERRGLAYSIHSYTSAYHNAGYLAIYAATGADRLQQLLSVLRLELQRLQERGIPSVDVERIKAMLETELILGLEGSAARMGLLARQLIYYGSTRTVEQIIEEIRAVEHQDVVEIATEVLNQEPLLTILGPVTH